MVQDDDDDEGVVTMETRKSDEEVCTVFNSCRTYYNSLTIVTFSSHFKCLPIFILLGHILHY